jgi:hypothetical protein
VSRGRDRGWGRRSPLADTALDVEVERLDDEGLALLLERQVVLPAPASDERRELERWRSERVKVEGPVNVDEPVVVREEVGQCRVGWVTMK